MAVCLNHDLVHALSLDKVTTMLSAFTARPIVELKQRDKSKIESVLTYGDSALRTELGAIY